MVLVLALFWHQLPYMVLDRRTQARGTAWSRKVDAFLLRLRAAVRLSTKFYAQRFRIVTDTAHWVPAMFNSEQGDLLSCETVFYRPCSAQTHVKICGHESAAKSRAETISAVSALQAKVYSRRPRERKFHTLCSDRQWTERSTKQRCVCRQYVHRSVDQDRGWVRNKECVILRAARALSSNRWLECKLPRVQRSRQVAKI